MEVVLPTMSQVFIRFYTFHSILGSFKTYRSWLTSDPGRETAPQNETPAACPPKWGLWFQVLRGDPPQPTHLGSGWRQKASHFL